MLGIRPYRATDADTVLAWCQNEKSFYQWSCGMLGTYPPTKVAFRFVETLMPFVAFDGAEPVGFFTLRKPDAARNKLLRLGFVIVDPQKRGKGYGKAMLRLGIKFAFELYGAAQLTIGVFENNPAAYRCYKALGFCEAKTGNTSHRILNENWVCIELEMENPSAT